MRWSSFSKSSLFWRFSSFFSVTYSLHVKIISLHALETHELINLINNKVRHRVIHLQYLSGSVTVLKHVASNILSSAKMLALDKTFSWRSRTEQFSHISASSCSSSFGIEPFVPSIFILWEDVKNIREGGGGKGCPPQDNEPPLNALAVLLSPLQMAQTFKTALTFWPLY